VTLKEPLERDSSLFKKLKIKKFESGAWATSAAHEAT